MQHFFHIPSSGVELWSFIQSTSLYGDYANTITPTLGELPHRVRSSFRLEEEEK